jgi:putative transposase
MLRTFYDRIAYEALNVKGLAQGNLAKSIMDAAWAILLFQLRYKAESAGAYAIAVNRRGTTQICSACGEKVPKELSQLARLPEVRTIVKPGP